MPSRANSDASVLACITSDSRSAHVNVAVYEVSTCIVRIGRIGSGLTRGPSVTAYVRPDLLAENEPPSTNAAEAPLDAPANEFMLVDVPSSPAIPTSPPKPPPPRTYTPGPSPLQRIIPAPPAAPVPRMADPEMPRK